MFADARMVGVGHEGDAFLGSSAHADLDCGLCEQGLAAVRCMSPCGSILALTHKGGHCTEGRRISPISQASRFRLAVWVRRLHGVCEVIQRRLVRSHLMAFVGFMTF